MKNFYYAALLLILFSCGSYHPVLVSKEYLFAGHSAGFRQCHASTLTETRDGRLLCAWFGGDHEGDASVKIWMSELDRKTWSLPKAVADGRLPDGTVLPAWNPVLYTIPESDSVFLFYKAGANPRTWEGWYKTSADQGKHWSEAVRIGKGLIGPVKNRPLLLADGNLISPSSREFTEKDWKVHLERSKDHGKSWEIIPVNHEQKEVQVIQPSIIEHRNGMLQLLARSRQNRVLTAFSHNGGNAWTPWEETNLANPNSGTDAIRLKNNLLLIVYNPETSGQNWWEGRTKLHVALSGDGKTWKDVLVLENGQKGDEYSYPTVLQASDGKIHISYTWNRSRIVHAVLK